MKLYKQKHPTDTLHACNLCALISLEQYLAWKLLQRDSTYYQKILHRNPKKQQKLLDFLERFTLVENVIVDTEIFKHTFKCTFPGCGACCFAGTLVKENEIQRVTEIIDEIIPYLNESKKRRLNKLDNKFYTNYPLDEYHRLRTWNGSCIFLMDDKRCAVHTYCNESGKNWINFHFDLCVTYPLRIYGEVGIIQIEEELFRGDYVFPCFNKKREPGVNHEIDLIYSMRDVIIDRFGTDFWVSLEIEYKSYLESWF